MTVDDEGGIAGLADTITRLTPEQVSEYVRRNPSQADVVEAAIEHARGRAAAWAAHNRTPTAWATPGELAKALDPSTVQTPALDLLDRALLRVESADSLRLIISMSPQEGKSERTTHYGVEWMLNRNRDLRIGIVSYGEDVARRFAYQIRNDLRTFDGTDDLVDLGMRLRPDNKAAGKWNLDYPAKGGVYAIGIGGALTSRPLDMLVIDDPVKDYRAADSLMQSEDAWTWWQSVARPRLAPGAPVVVILTRWHESDLAGRLLAKQAQDEAAGLVNYDRWEVINIPAQADHDPNKGEVDVLGREPGEFMQSARGRTQEQWEATKAATAPRIWSALYQGRPTPDSGDVIKRAWVRRYTEPMWSQQPDGSYLVPDASEVLLSWDMTFKDNKSSDFVVGQVWVRKGAEVFITDQVHARLSFTATLAAVKRMVGRWPQATAKLVEDKANGTAVMDSLRKEVPGLVAVEPHGSKFARASAVSPFVEAGNVWFPSAEVALFDVDSLIEEAVAFPNAAHDDQVDALSQALARFFLRPGQGAAFVEAWKTQAVPPSAGGVLAVAEVAAVVCSCRDRRWRDGVCMSCGHPTP